MSKNNPWDIDKPTNGSIEEERKYRRSKALSRMQRFIEMYPTMELRMQTHLKKRYEYRLHCVKNWQQYLNGESATHTGRKMIK